MSRGRGRTPSLLWARLNTLRDLGVGNVARVLSYRLRLRAGVHPVQRRSAELLPSGPFFRAAAASRRLSAPVAWREKGNYFGWYRPDLHERPPDWHASVLDGRRAEHAEADWWTIPDFDPATGDIKAIWEASRFDWAVNLAQQAASGMAASADRLNSWLADWCARNPAYRGHNWKCGQEASIRLMHLAVAALILDETTATLPALTGLLKTHLHRIEPTVAYAAAQDNNHGTSEAAALLIGGSWLERLDQPEGSRWLQLGRTLLRDRVLRLIETDGSFSQYSTVYHRLLLDTMSLVEIWRRHLGLASFDDLCMSRLAAASAWLRAMVDPTTGDAPNWGANDGTNLLPLTEAGYRDFRPSVQLASALFDGRVAYTSDPWPEHLAWLGVPPGRAQRPAEGPFAFHSGSVAIMALDGARVMFRYPGFRFRPHHADALHVDLWVAGENVLRDGGTFSYAAEEEWRDYFTGVRAHNTVQFDDHEQMLRLDRFLWGSWLRAKSRECWRHTNAGWTAGASYHDPWGAEHSRSVSLARGRLTVTDRLSGFDVRAVVRWRLCPGNWVLNGCEISNGRHRLDVTADVPLTRCQLVGGFESRYYLERTAIPVLEAEVARPGVVTTRCRWDA